MRSTMYSACPGCHEKTLVQETGGTWRCTACSFDYGTLVGDESAREAWMLENLRAGPMSQLAVIHLHRVIRALPLVESNDAVVAFAARHGIALPTGKPTSPLWFVAALVGGLVALFTVLWAAFVR